MTYLATALQSFFTDYVHAQRNLSETTIASYRDTSRLLIKHVCATTATSADQIRLEDIDRDQVTTFLEHLINERANSAATRNARLIAIRVLFAHILPDHPEHAETIRRVLTIPPAKTAKPLISYLNEDETEALLGAPDTATWTGRRDQMMLALVINTGTQAPGHPNQRHDRRPNARLPQRTHRPALQCALPRPARQRALTRRH